MSFREKSAWGMGLFLVLLVILFIHAIFQAQVAQGDISILALAAALAVIVGLIVVQTVLAAIHHKEARQGADERENEAILQAGNWAGKGLSAMVALCALAFLLHRDGNLLFQMTVGAVLLGHLADYGFRILFLRRGV